MRALLAELIGTYLLVLIGCGSIVSNLHSDGALGLGGIALVWGATVSVLVYSLGGISGTHINPAVSLALAASSRFPKSQLGGYLVAQFAGACLASLTLAALFPAEQVAKIGTTPSVSLATAFAVEVAMTFWLMLTVLSVSEGPADKAWSTGLWVGAVVCIEVLVAGPLTGASMNPARSFGPALVNSQWQHLWIYLSATTAGALLALPVWAQLREKSSEST
jgi:MIP family channel proteins